MKYKNNIFLSAAILSLSIAIVGNVIVNKISFSATADDTTYQINLNSTKNKFTNSSSAASSNATIYTEQGGEVKFTYSSLKDSGSDTSWQIIEKGGNFVNSLPIHGLKSITINVNNENPSYKIAYSSNFVDIDDQTTSFTSKTTTFNFYQQYPNYFKLENTGDEDLDVASVILTYTCTNHYSKLTLASSDTNKGTVSGSGYYVIGAQINVTVNIISGIFLGWYDDKDQLISSEETFTFTIPEHDCKLIATFMSDEEEAWKKKHGVIPVVTENNQVTYGLYPQTVLNNNESSEDNDIELINELNELTEKSIDPNNGWYFYNNEYYAKITANTHVTGYKFDNGDEIKSGTTYWFKCEVITWDILTGSDGEYYLLSNKLLDAHCYYTSPSTRTIDEEKVYANNYEYSDIRAWLNGYDGSGYEVGNYSGKGFLNTAFALNSSYIKTTEVDNSAATTNSTGNTYACENTQDKVFLPSYQDYLNANYGFPTSTGASTIREAKTTDYARANGAYSSPTTNNLNNGWYLTRSPSSSSRDLAWRVYNDGDLKDINVIRTYTSVRPSLSLKIS